MSSAQLSDPIVQRPPVERAQVALARAALLVDIAARAMAELGAEAEEVAPRQRFMLNQTKSAGEALRYGQWQPISLEMCVKLAVDFGAAGAQLHDWADSFAAWQKGRD